MTVAPRKDDAPINIITKIDSSTKTCPMKTEGPALQPFLIDAAIVANIMGPGIIAADMPTVKPKIIALVSSIMVFPLKRRNRTVKEVNIYKYI